MIQYISKPFKWFFKLEAASGLVLLIAAILALFISNSNLSEFYFHILDTFKGPIGKIVPNIEFLLYNLYETINDIALFLKDLI